MRRTLALAAAGLGLAATLLPVQSASAVCLADLSWVGGPSCVNPCGSVLQAYDRADAAVKDRLPDHLMDCLA